MTDWICEVTIADCSAAELLELQAAVKARFGVRARTRTVQKWLRDEERKPSPPPVLTHVVVDSAGQKPHRNAARLRGRKIA